ncbi:uncharacterized protein LOC126292153 [Schistocerca gregaria]|uniref:uncharacterized protein LOC126292153 n=1 Tax=Schistocerca gregaria TaxID=7010 RepID=UPI00211E3F64|nr:uncharacterized protein LOC126292153 [Schistocerca gregaria]XP_049841950.1 uncharacterized protein LOC126292153 [Schistocerca gregaria]XP_049841951.1 uncharacterized protein LOC126292153 [Schistocerca gregaria]
MSCQSNGDHEMQRTLSSHSGIRKSLTDSEHQFQIRGPRIQTIPRAKAHAMLAYTLPVGQGTSFSVIHTQTEAVQPIYTLAKMSEDNHFSHKSTSAPDKLLVAENRSTEIVHPDHPPVADFQPQPGYNLSDIYGQHILTHGPIPPLRQIMIRGPQSTVAHTPPTFAVMGHGPRVSNILRQTKYPTEVNSVGHIRQLHAEIPARNPTGAPGRGGAQAGGHPVQYVVNPSGISEQQHAVAPVSKHQVYTQGPVGNIARAQGHDARQLLGPPVQYVRTPCGINVQQQVDVSATKYGAHIITPHGIIPTEAQIPLTPANGTEPIQQNELKMNTPGVSPLQQQQTGYVVQQTYNPPTEHDIALKTGVNCNVAQPSRAFSGEDRVQPAICVLYKAAQADHNPIEEPERRLPKQDLAVPISRQTSVAPRIAPDVIPVTQVPKVVHPVGNVAGRDQVNYPTCANFPLQELTNTLSYNITASSQKPSTVEDTPEVTSEGDNFSLANTLRAQAQEIIKPRASDPKYRSTPRKATKPIFSDREPRDDTEMQLLEHEMKCVVNVFRNEGKGDTNPEHTLQPQDQAGDVSVLTYISKVPEREQDNVQTVTAQQQALHPVCKSSDKLEEVPSQQKLDSATGNQMSLPDASAAAFHSSTSKPQWDTVGPTVHSYIFNARNNCYISREEVYQTIHHTTINTSNLHSENEIPSSIIIINPFDANTSDTPNMHNETSFVRQMESGDSFVKNNSSKAVSRQLGVSQAAGTPGNMHRENRSNIGFTLPHERQKLSRSRESPKVMSSWMTNTDLESTRKTVNQQHKITESRAGSQKRHYVRGELSTPAAKKRVMFRLGTELQCASSSTTFLPQDIDSNTLSVNRQATDNTLGSGAFAVTTGNILHYSDEDIVELESINGAGMVADRHPLKKEKEREITTDERQETVLDVGISVVQKRQYEHERDDQGKKNAIVLESENATEEYSNAMMAFSQQLDEEISDYEEAKDNVDDVSTDSEETSASHDDDCNMELDETETQTAEDEEEDDSDDFDEPPVTAFPEHQQVTEEQKVDIPPDVPQEDEEESVSDEYETDVDTDTDSGLSIDKGMGIGPSCVAKCTSILKQVTHMLKVITENITAFRDEPPDDSSVVQAQMLEDILVEHELVVESQYAEWTSTSNVHASGSMGKEHEVAATVGDVPNKTSNVSPVAFEPQTKICQDTMTENSGLFQVPAINVEDESDTLYEQRENECEPIEGEDSSGTEMGSHHAQDKNMDNDIDCNVTTDNEATQGNITSTVEDIITECNEAQLRIENERNSPSDDTDHNYSGSSDISDDFFF